MKKNSLTKQITLLAAVLLSGMFASCVYDKDVETKAAEGDGKLIININSSAVGAGLRATVINNGDNSVNSDNEKTITTMAIGIFSSDGATKKGYEYLTNQTGKIANWTTVTEFKNLTNSIAVGDKVYIVANVNSTVSDLLKAKTTADDFVGVANSIDQSLIFANSYAADQSIDAKKLPMFGSGTVAAASDNTTGNYEVNVKLIHMLSKVTLNKLTLAGVADGTKFTPKAIFLINVPKALTFKFNTISDVTTDYLFGGVNTEFCQGESEDVATSTNVTTNTLTTREYRDYLGTGPLTVSEVTTAAPQTTTYTFYTMPNNAAATNDTRLVIAGEWLAAGESDATEVWYSVQLKNVASDGTTLSLGVYPNCHYKLNVELKRKGAVKVTDDATGAYNDLTAENTVNTDIEISNWTDGSKTTTFGGNGDNPTEN